jgi:hypothetical protein
MSSVVLRATAIAEPPLLSIFATLTTKLSPWLPCISNVVDMKVVGRVGPPALKKSQKPALVEDSSLADIEHASGDSLGEVLVVRRDEQGPLTADERLE